MKKMQWNVFMRDMNSHKITVFNVFDHATFSKKVEKLRGKKLSRDEFSKGLKSAAMYHFWSKCEYEVVVTSWPPYVEQEELKRLASIELTRLASDKPYYRTDVRLEIGEKIDVYQQLALNWDKFVDYAYTA